MKKLIAIVFLALAFGAKSQSIVATSGSNTTKIRANGNLESAGAVKGFIKDNGTIENAAHVAIGYIKSDGTIENAAHKAVGYVKGDGTVQNASHATIGFVRSNLHAYNASNVDLGSSDEVSDMNRLAVAFFFFKL